MNAPVCLVYGLQTQLRASGCSVCLHDHRGACVNMEKLCLLVLQHTKIVLVGRVACSNVAASQECHEASDLWSHRLHHGRGRRPLGPGVGIPQTGQRRLRLFLLGLLGTDSQASLLAQAVAPSSRQSWHMPLRNSWACQPRTGYL